MGWRRPEPAGDPVTEAERQAAATRIAEQRAAAVSADLERVRAESVLRQELDASAREAARVERAARAEDARIRRTARAERRAERMVRVRGGLARLRLVAPLLLVNAMAVTGQVGYGLDHLTPPGTPLPGAFAMAVLFAAALESIGLYVGWHAHTALLAGASASAARLRLSSYTVATVVAGINYAHYAGPRLSPTAPAVAYGLVSLLSPWLWGLHSRRERHLVLERAGLVDVPGARFGAERWRAFPVRTWAARRWSIAHGVTDPGQAWLGYHADRATRHTGATSRLGFRARSARVSVAPPSALDGGGAASGRTDTDTPPGFVAATRVAVPGTPVTPGRGATGDGTAPTSGARRRRPAHRGGAGRSGAGRPRRAENKVGLMRAHWDREVAAGRVPTGADLATAAGSAKSLGRRKAAEWRPELRRNWQADTATPATVATDSGTNGDGVRSGGGATATTEPARAGDPGGVVLGGVTGTGDSLGLRLALVPDTTAPNLPGGTRPTADQPAARAAEGWR